MVAGDPCLFCGDLRSPKTAEHVIQEAFGSRLCLEEEVCDECNTRRFSEHDKRFVDYVKQLHAPASSGFRGVPLIHGRLGHCFDASLGLWTTVSYGRSGWATLPQILKHPNGTWRALASTNAELAKMTAELGSTKELSVSAIPVDNVSPDFQVSVIRSAPRRYLVKGSDRSELEATVVKIRARAFIPNRGTEWSEQRMTSPVEFKGEIPVGSIVRSLAKNTVNFICAAFGPNVARSPLLSKVTAIALGRQSGLTDGTVAIKLPNATATQLDIAMSELARHAIMALPLPHAEEVPIVNWLYRRPIGIVYVPSAALPGSPPLAVLAVDDSGAPKIALMPRDLEWIGDLFARVRRRV
jgi:hypothetical protein